MKYYVPLSDDPSRRLYLYRESEEGQLSIFLSLPTGWYEDWELPEGQASEEVTLEELIENPQWWESPIYYDDLIQELI